MIAASAREKIAKLLLAAGLGVTASAALAAPPGTGFTYQGVLEQNDALVDGLRDMRFRLYNAATGGSPLQTVQVFDVDVSDGVFTADIDFGVNAWASNDQLWLEIEVGPAGGSQAYELLGRQELTATPYALNTRGIWVNSDGKVGINTSSPLSMLNVKGRTGESWPVRITGPQAAGMNIKSDGTNSSWAIYHDQNTDHLAFRDSTTGVTRMMIRGDNGNVGIGPNSPLYSFTINPDAGSASIALFGAGQPTGINMAAGSNGLAIGKVNNDGTGFEYLGRWNNDGFLGVNTDSPTHVLTVRGEPGQSYPINVTGPQAAGIRFDADGTASSWGIYHDQNTDHLNIRDSTTGVTRLLVRGDNGFVGIGTTDPTTTLDVDGAVTIRGGADIVEGFESICDTAFEPGTVLVIDPANPGMLMCAAGAYDRKVAGVVSGAGGVQPGIKLGQDGVMDGDIPVAMTGRVYVKATAANGAIEPGDLLTTSGVAGHAMKATDAGRSHGAVIGKAMTALDAGEGLVLVLVNLQ